MKLKINFEPGKKCEDDRKIYIKTEDQGEEGELVSMFKVALLVNQLGINDRIVAERNGWKYLFGDFMEGVLEHAENGIDWGDPNNYGKVKALCEECFINEKKINHDLLRRAQRKLEDFMEEIYEGGLSESEKTAGVDIL